MIIVNLVGTYLQDEWSKQMIFFVFLTLSSILISSLALNILQTFFIRNQIFEQKDSVRNISFLLTFFKRENIHNLRFVRKVKKKNSLNTFFSWLCENFSLIELLKTGEFLSNSKSFSLKKKHLFFLIKATHAIFTQLIKIRITS
jgi:hypothetical protein